MTDITGHAQPTKAISLRTQGIFWGTALLLCIGFLWLFEGILLPFILGLTITYLLDPVVTWLGRKKVPRWAAALLIVGLFMVALLALLIVLVPVLYREIMSLAAAAPDYLDRIGELLAPYVAWIEDYMGEDRVNELEDTIRDNIGEALQFGGGILAGLITGGQALISVLYVLVLTPIVAFFSMIQWPNIKGWIYGMLPRQHYDTIKNLLGEMDRKVAGFIRGQVTIAFILGIAYIIALSLAGLNFSVLIGIIAGILSVIPLVGSTVGLILSAAVAWLQSGELSYVILIAGIFLAGQVIETNIITPKILGRSVGLHPLWVIFALIAGSYLMGFAGMLIAVPVIAVIGVLTGFGIQKYKDSQLYQGPMPFLAADEPPDPAPQPDKGPSTT